MKNSITDLPTIRACILGHAVADALGVPAEFLSREALEDRPVTGMISGGVHNMPAGSWSDDTSMTLCALSALGEEVFSWEAVMDSFVRWYDKGEFTPTGVVFDVGGTCADAI